MRALALVLLGLIASGCAPLLDAFEEPTAPETEAGRCLALFAETDTRIAEAGVVDAAYARIEGFPHLRVNRFLASFRTRPLDDTAFGAWTKRLRALDREARGFELANLPDAYAALSPRVEDCGNVLLARDLRDAARREALLAAARVEDHYSDVNRVLGLYPLTALPVGLAYANWRKNHLGLFRESRANAAPITRLVPDASPPLAPEAVATLLRAASANPLGIPAPGPEATQRLLESFAPVFEIETAGPADRIGAPHWEGRGTIAVETTTPLAYGQLSHVWFRGEARLQLSYVVWFPARPKSAWLDPLAGHLDGVVWRVTLGGDGRPLVYDTIHACGCYHLFFPVAPLAARKAGLLADFEEPPLIPMPAPPLGKGERLALHLRAGSHYLTGLRAAGTEEPAGAPYALYAYDALRSLPLPAGGRQSLFGPDGRIEGTERLERFFLWPMGVPSAGAMRQWGTHATAFIGRRHFDDPDLLEKIFGK